MEARTWPVMVSVIRATSRPHRSQYWRSPQALTSRDADGVLERQALLVHFVADRNLTRCRPCRTRTPRWPCRQVSHSPFVRNVSGGRPVRSAVLISHVEPLVVGAQRLEYLPHGLEVRA